VKPAAHGSSGGNGERVVSLEGVMHFGGGQEGIESYFSEEKEAKRLLFVYKTRRCWGLGLTVKSFLVLFFKKEHPFLPSALAMHHASS
jgi:hypothetical protein